MTVRGVFHGRGACMVLLLWVSAASQTHTNYYATLSVDPTATDTQIKKAFRALAVRYHPDKNKSADAEKIFREIAEAYTVLSNKEKRRLYDHLGHEAYLKNEASQDPGDGQDPIFHFSFADLFENLHDDPFMEEPVFRWTFNQDGMDEENLQEHYIFQDSSIFEPMDFMFFGDGDEKEEESNK
ncbi:dnaJ homolog subfamily B member 9-like [Thalassophryne amazonica]|uniref:dnaJ homolog subfamily B member 9-like n=1 Tax=Thalassophryne amazonica TaxID=390379 RepID=UPI0014713FAF|nr:dnaJ homolog subfamily B member 9-like [Thalassophryne amazonica]